MPPAPVAGATPVRFDDVAAQRLIAALEALDATLVALVRAEADRARGAVTHWQGATRRWFDADRAALVHLVTGQAVAARRAIDEVRAASAAAAALQQARNSEALAAHEAEVAHLAAPTAQSVPAGQIPS